MGLVHNVHINICPSAAISFVHRVCVSRQRAPVYIFPADDTEEKNGAKVNRELEGPRVSLCVLPICDHYEV